MKQTPANSHFWEAIAENGAVSQIDFAQQPGDEVALLDGYLDLQGNKATIIFMPPYRRTFSWPLFVAQGAVAFSTIPKVFKEAQGMYSDVCEDHGESLFFDMVGTATHRSYKGAVYGDHSSIKASIKRIAIQYSIDNPTDMEPIVLEVM